MDNSLRTSFPRPEEILNLPSTPFQTKGQGTTIHLFGSLQKHSQHSLIREVEGKQFPVYYVSKSLLDAETHYTQLEKLALALITVARKLQP